MNQVVVGRPKSRLLSEQWTAGAASEIRRLLSLGVLKNPKIEVTPSLARRRPASIYGIRVEECAPARGGGKLAGNARGAQIVIRFSHEIVMASH